MVFCQVPWSDEEGKPCRVKNTEEVAAPEYIDFRQAGQILASRFNGGLPSEEEIVYWLETGELTAFAHEFANAGRVDFSAVKLGNARVKVTGADMSIFPKKLEGLNGVIQQLDTLYFSGRQLASFVPKTRWHSYDDLVSIAQRHGISQDRLNRLIWSDPNAMPMIYPRGDESVLQAHFYPSGWVKKLENRLAPRFAQTPIMKEHGAQGNRIKPGLAFRAVFPYRRCPSPP